MTKFVLFDLDGTLLPMDQTEFTKAYFGLLAKRLAPLGYEPKALIDAIWLGTAAMVKNTGEKTNEAVFWDRFSEIFGEQALSHLPYFESFYIEDFDKARSSCGYNPEAKLCVDAIKAKGFRIALATNPIFPSIATEKRIGWAGLSPEDFELYTTYENSRHSKPNLDYYKDILAKLGAKAEECLMVGNDVGEDMIAEKLGMRVFLLTDNLINKGDADISHYPKGSFTELMAFIASLND